jgi:pantoate--beta-alanine ligase
MSALLIRGIPEVRSVLARVHGEGKIIGLVPTMGALHAGHGRLIETARRECGCVAVSVFVNPIQFNSPNDYERYPRTLDADVRFSEALGADIVFAPEISVMYPCPQRAYVDMGLLTDGLCGKFRPGHFRGVATVVTKLLNIVQPDRAYFGEKDAQQLAVIRRMVQDLDMPVTIVGVPTVREPSGLALSSRNRHLSDEERSIAPALYQSLRAAEKMIAEGARNPEDVKRAALAILAAQPQMRVEYFEVVDPGDMQPVTEIRGAVLVAAAVWLGSTRLIDNVLACKREQP